MIEMNSLGALARACLRLRKRSGKRHSRCVGRFEKLESRSLLAANICAVDDSLLETSMMSWPAFTDVASSGWEAASYGGDPYGGDPYGGDPYGGDPYGGDPYGGDPYGGDPYGGDPCGDDPYGGDPYGGDPNIAPIISGFEVVFLSSGDLQLSGRVVDDDSPEGLRVFFGSDLQAECWVASEGEFSLVVNDPSVLAGVVSASFTDQHGLAADTVWRTFG